MLELVRNILGQLILDKLLEFVKICTHLRCELIKVLESFLALLMLGFKILTEIVVCKIFTRTNEFWNCELFGLHKVKFLLQILLNCVLVCFHQILKSIVVSLRCGSHF